LSDKTVSSFKTIRLICLICLIHPPRERDAAAAVSAAAQMPGFEK
jgi:hypothetical protein